MNRPSNTPTSNASHEDWELRLQDWLDGGVSADEADAVQRHMAGCTSCTQLVEDLRQVDEQLQTMVPAEPALGAQFDARLFALIAEEESTRERVRKAARQTIPTEELERLRSASRRMLIRVSCVVAVVLVGAAWLLASGALPFLSPATIALTIANVTPVQWLSIGLVGGVASLGLTHWLQSA